MSSNFRNKLGNSSGFTLLEVLIAMFLLVIISLGIYQATTETYRLRDILVHEGDFQSAIRLSMGILERDVALMYTPLVIASANNADKNKDPNNPQNTPQDLEALGRPLTFWSSPLDKTGIRPARFQGSSNKISFISTSGIRVYKDAPSSEFVRVSYSLEDDKNPPFGVEPGTKILVKTESPNVFDEDEAKDKFIKTYPLLQGVRKLAFTFYRKEKQTWENRWDSESQDLRYQMPDMLKVTMEVVGPSRQFFEGIYQFRPEIPFNGLKSTQ